MTCFSSLYVRTPRPLAVLLCISVFASPAGAQSVDETHPRSGAPVTLLQINDVYSTVPIDGRGGLARVATLDREIAATGRAPLMLLAGDFLSSSVASTVFKGEQMIAALNAVGLDVATLGNHEFDFGLDVLRQRMREAKWDWVVSNVIDRETGNPIGGAAPFLIRTVNSLRIGLIGLCLTHEGMPADRLARIELVEPLEAAGRYIPELRKQGVDVIVALTHLTYAEDRALAERFPEIDVIIGGHEHSPITSTVGRTLISKAGSEAKFVARIDLNRRDPKTLEKFYELVPITDALRDDPAAGAVIDEWEARLGKELELPVGRTSVPLDGRNTRVRSMETNLGNLLADAIRADVGAEVALVNGGGIRSDKIYQPGSLSRRNLLEMHPFGNVVCKIGIPGRVLLEALNAGVSGLPTASGRFPQVSGLTYRVDLSAPTGMRVRDVKVGGEPLDLDRQYTVALPDYILEGGDGYTMFNSATRLVSPEAGHLIVTALEQYLAARGEVAPSVQGRITIGQ